MDGIIANSNEREYENTVAWPNSCWPVIANRLNIALMPTAPMKKSGKSSIVPPACVLAVTLDIP